MAAAISDRDFHNLYVHFPAWVRMEVDEATLLEGCSRHCKNVQRRQNLKSMVWLFGSITGSAGFTSGDKLFANFRDSQERVWGWVLREFVQSPWTITHVKRSDCIFPEDYALFLIRQLSGDTRGRGLRDYLRQDNRYGFANEISLQRVSHKTKRRDQESEEKEWDSDFDPQLHKKRRAESTSSRCSSAFPLAPGSFPPSDARPGTPLLSPLSMVDSTLSSCSPKPLLSVDQVPGIMGTFDSSVLVSLEREVRSLRARVSTLENDNAKFHKALRAGEEELARFGHKGCSIM